MNIKNKRVIFALIIIFICGVITGTTLAPLFFHHSLGNPFQKNSLSEHVFFTNHIDWKKLDNSTKVKVKDLIDRKRRDYESSLEIFRLESGDVFDDFTDELKQILPSEEFDDYMRFVKIEKDKRERRFQMLNKKD